MSTARRATRLLGAAAVVLTGGCAGSSAGKASDSAVDSAAVQAPAPARDSNVAVVRTDTPPGSVPNVSPASPPVSAPPSSTPQPAPTPSARPSEDVMIGRVTTGGLAAEPVTSLQVEGRGGVTLVGPLEPELRRLNGATVSVAGAPAAGGGRAGAFTPSRYDVVSIDGVRPSVGTLVARGNETLLASSDTVRLAAPPAELRSKAGAKVWIVGRRSGADLTVQAYGIIREP